MATLGGVVEAVLDPKGFFHGDQLDVLVPLPRQPAKPAIIKTTSAQRTVGIRMARESFKVGRGAA
jgi:hypothetical protein